MIPDLNPMQSPREAGIIVQARLEQWRDSVLDNAADIYSMRLIPYGMFAGDRQQIEMHWKGHIDK